MDCLIPASKLVKMIINKKKRTCHLLDFALIADLRVKLKKIAKLDKYLDLVGKLKKRRP